MLEKTIHQRKDLNQEECVKICYYVIDSWGSKHYQKTCETIINTLTDNYNEQLKDHAEYMQAHDLKCCCKFEINFPVIRRIQHSNYENCGWYSLYFTRMNRNELMHWAQTDLNTYRKIKPNYNAMVKYFHEDFIPRVEGQLPKCKHFVELKDHINFESRNRPKKVNQCCCSQKYVLPEYF